METHALKTRIFFVIWNVFRSVQIPSVILSILFPLFSIRLCERGGSLQSLLCGTICIHITPARLQSEGNVYTPVTLCWPIPDVEVRKFIKRRNNAPIATFLSLLFWSFFFLNKNAHDYYIQPLSMGQCRERQIVSNLWSNLFDCTQISFILLSGRLLVLIDRVITPGGILSTRSLTHPTSLFLPTTLLN